MKFKILLYLTVDKLNTNSDGFVLPFFRLNVFNSIWILANPARPHQSFHNTKPGEAYPLRLHQYSVNKSVIIRRLNR